MVIFAGYFLFDGSFFFFFGSFTYRSKMIIKGVSDIIRIIASPLSKESTGGKLDATSFREITDLIPFHVFFILCQLLSKYLL